MDFHAMTEGLLRWIHVVSGILWIGLLYFFNFVNATFAPTLDADAKKKVVPQLMPRALYFFRWGAAFTWVTGALVLIMAYYAGPYLFDGGNSWNPLAFIMVALTFLGFFIYDPLVKTVLKNNQHLFIVGWVLSTLLLYGYHWAGFGTRGFAIHLGGAFGTIMAMNVWMRIWPAQQKIITAVKNGEKPEDAIVAMAGARSKHNTYMSVPLVFMMITKSMVAWADHPWKFSIVILVGWLGVYWLYNKSKTVQGF